jgi:type VI secretion system protein ImpG
VSCGPQACATGETCRFRTCHPTTLWPITVETASLRGRPIVAPANPQASGAVAVLRLTLRCLGDQMTFTKLGPDRLRFFLRGQPQLVLPLYELLFNNAVSVALADSAADAAPIILRPDCIRPVGFDKSEGMLPYPARSFVGYRLLTEYFTFPEKFLFFDLTQLSAKVLLEAKNKLDVFIYLNKSSTDLERSISDDAFAVGCTPIVNLFRQRAEPIALTRSISEYRVVPDARRPGVTEVYSVDTVSSTGPDGTETSFLPFYSIKHAAAARSQRTFWHPSRRAAGGRDPGTELFLSLVDLDFNPSVPADTVLRSKPPASTATGRAGFPMAADIPICSWWRRWPGSPACAASRRRRRRFARRCATVRCGAWFRTSASITCPS